MTALLNNVGTGDDEFADHPDNALSLKDQAAYARGERKRDGELIQPTYTPHGAREMIEKFIMPLKHVTGPEV